MLERFILMSELGFTSATTDELESATIEPIIPINKKTAIISANDVPTNEASNILKNPFINI